MDKKIVFGVIFLFSLLVSILITRGQTSGCQYTTCATYGCLYIQNSTSDNKAIFDGGGFIDIEGGLTAGDASGSGTNDFIIKNSGGTVIAWIDDATGNMSIAGSVSDDQQTGCSAPANSFIIQNSSGDCVAYIDSSGNVWARGRLCYSSSI